MTDQTTVSRGNPAARHDLSALWVVLLTLPALWPLARAGFFVSDDGRFHVYRIAALADAWTHGVLYPRLFPEFGFGYGQAVLHYYAPLSYAPGAALALLGAGPVWAAKGVIALGFVLAALAAYGFGRAVWGTSGGILAAVAYTYFPYHLADAYVRGALPEHFAFVWPPLILWALVATFRDEDPRPAMLGGALAWAGLVYTHNLTALLMAPTAALFLLAVGLWLGSWRRTLWVAASVGLAVLLAAPLWLPFLAESGQVGIALGPSEGYVNHLASLGQVVQWAALYRYRAQPGGAADHPLAWTTAALVVAVGGLAAWRVVTGRGVTARPLVIYFLGLTAGAAFLTTAPALGVWQLLAPALAHLQYPWRFLTLAGVGVMGLAGALPSLLGVEDRATAHPDSKTPYGWARAAVIGVGLVLVIQPLVRIPWQALPMTAAEAWAPDRMWREDAEAGQIGATWTAEFLPLTVKEQRWALGRSREGAVDGPALTPRPAVHIAERRFAAYDIAVDAANPLTLYLHQFRLPAWHAQVDGVTTATYPGGDLGLVAVDTPAGSHVTRFRFGPTPAWLAGMALGLAGAFLWGLLAWRWRAGRRGWLWIGAIALPAAAVILALNMVGIGEQAWTPRLPVDGAAALGNAALLIGYDVEPARGAADRAVDITLYWFALRENGSNVKSFVHLLGPDGQVIAQHDGDPGGGYTPTTRWLPGEIVPDRHRLALPESSGPASYGLKAGLYTLGPDGPVNLMVDPATPDGRVDLGAFEAPR